MAITICLQVAKGSVFIISWGHIPCIMKILIVDGEIQYKKVNGSPIFISVCCGVPAREDTYSELLS